MTRSKDTCQQAFFIIISVILATIFPNSATAQTSPEIIDYHEFCKIAASNNGVFANFKSNEAYRKILEHLSYEDGLRYLEIIREEYPDLLEKCDDFRVNDSLGNPQTYTYESIGTFSPTTLRYIKTAGDIQYQFGDLKNLHIVEIGGGYGGLCRILARLCGFASYTLIDLPNCNRLSKKYLDKLGVKNVRYIDSDTITSSHKSNEAHDLNKIDLSKVDLIISNYAFSTLPRTEQDAYISKVVCLAPRGYITWNHSDKSMSPDEFITYLFKNKRSGEILPELPRTHQNNQLITWKPVDERSRSHLAGKVESTPSKKPQKNNGVTYGFSGGRFGDNLISYFHAKWIAWKHGLPFFYIPFSGAEMLQLSVREPPLSDEYTFNKTFTISKIEQVTKTPNSTLFTIPFACDCKFEHDNQTELQKSLLGYSPYIAVDWEHPEFHKEVVECLTPKSPIPTLPLPHDKMTVAVHVRRGGDWDNYSEISKVLPLKFPPDNYYISQIKRVLELCPDKPLYVYIFTDDKHPEVIVKKYSLELKSPKITWGYGWSNKFQDGSAMWRDFYSIGKFDCLIQSTSNFSAMASQLGQYLFTITPTSGYYKDNQAVVDGVCVKFNGIHPKSI